MSFVSHAKFSLTSNMFDKRYMFDAGRNRRESSKNWILTLFPKPNTISLRDYQLILCMLAFLN